MQIELVDVCLVQRAEATEDIPMTGLITSCLATLAFKPGEAEPFVQAVNKAFAGAPRQAERESQGGKIVTAGQVRARALRQFAPEADDALRKLVSGEEGVQVEDLTADVSFKLSGVAYLR